MISVLVLCLPTHRGHQVSPGEAVRTLASLVPATIEGLVRDVCLVTIRHVDGLSHVADHAGCALVEAGTFEEMVKAGAKQARCALILALRSGAMVDRPFIDETASLMPILAAASAAPAYVLKTSGSRIAERVFPALAPSVGLLLPRDRLITALPKTFSALFRSNRPHRTLKSKAWVGG